jgi:hypothetical protein
LTLPNNIFTALNSQELWQLPVTPIANKIVYKMVLCPDGSIQYQVWQVIASHQPTEFVTSYAYVGKNTIFGDILALVGNSDCNINHFDVITTVELSDLDANDIYMTLSRG